MKRDLTFLTLCGHSNLSSELLAVNMAQPGRLCDIALSHYVESEMLAISAPSPR